MHGLPADIQAQQGKLTTFINGLEGAQAEWQKLTATSNEKGTIQSMLQATADIFKCMSDDESARPLTKVVRDARKTVFAAARLTDDPSCELTKAMNTYEAG